MALFLVLLNIPVMPKDATLPIRLTMLGFVLIRVCDHGSTPLSLKRCFLIYDQPLLFSAMFG